MYFCFFQKFITHTFKAAKKEEILAEFPLFSQDDYIFLEDLGEYESFYLQKAYSKIIGCYVTVKSLSLVTPETLVGFIQEHKIRQKFETIKVSKHFLIYYGCFRVVEDGKETLKLIMENGIATLDELLKEGKTYEKEEIHKVLSSVISSLAILQENHMILGNLTPENLILVEGKYNKLEKKETFNYKISNLTEIYELKDPKYDFVSSQEFSALTEKYNAPETTDLQNRVFMFNPFKLAVYSLGKIATQMKGIFKDLKSFYDEPLKRQGIRQDYIIKHLINPNPVSRWDFIELNKYVNTYDPLTSFSRNNEVDCFLRSLAKKEDEKIFQDSTNSLKLFNKHMNLARTYLNLFGDTNNFEIHIKRVVELFEQISIQNKKKSIADQMTLRKLEIESRIEKGRLLFIKPEKREECESFWINVRDFCEENFSNESPKTDYLNYMAIICNALGKIKETSQKPDYTAGLELMKKSLSYDLEVHGEKNQHTVTVCKNIGQCFMNMFLFDRAHEKFNKCIEFQRDFPLSEQNYSVYQLMGDLAEKYAQHTGKNEWYLEAEKNYLKTVDIIQATKGKKWRGLADYYLKLSNYCYSLNEFQYAKKYMKKYSKLTEMNILIYWPLYSKCCKCWNETGSIICCRCCCIYKLLIQKLQNKENNYQKLLKDIRFNLPE